MLRRFVTKHEFDSWVRDMCNSYNNRGSEFINVRKLTIDPQEANGRTIIMNLKTGKTAVAKCHKDDEFSPGIGLAVAWAKYLNRPIPVIATYVDIEDLKFMDEFYTKRSEYRTYQYIGIRHNAIGQCIIIREKDTGFIYEFTLKDWKDNISSYNGKVWRLDK